MAIEPPHAVFHSKCPPGVKGTIIGIHTLLQIIGVDTFAPSVSEFLLQGAAREVEPWLVEVRAKFVVTRHPDHDGGLIGHEPEATFALTESHFRALAFGHVNKRSQHAQAGFGPNRA